jgi:AraC family transcriptional regulator
MNTHFSPITAGIPLKTVDTSAIRLTETIHPPGLRLPPHRHERPSIALVIKGSFIEEFGRNAYQCKAGAVVIKPAEAIHSDVYGSNGARSLIIELFPDFLPLIPAPDSVVGETHVIADAMSFIARRIYKEFSFFDACSILSIEGLILELLAQLIRQHTASAEKIPGWLNHAREMIKAEFRSSPDLKRIAQAAGIHPAHLARTFRKKFGCTVGEYLRQLRLNEAMKNLDYSEKSIAEISQDAGFYDHSHFVRCFKEYTGLTPSDYRRVTGHKRFRNSE